ncbi:heavy metal-responsive transcriptional regulator [Thiomicrospira cyclica]|uniref:Transcriptional regulator, MerR family n=1 Tax=Thiomicrospira cyclica (strain DSM 14477 / JCM 11371 / ALM1) TaxID=717773 RepID=F6DAU2_THICA|nr:heavy metal-responsive transcriptional regulator [Thiomicrospira cyclica]AEG31185.1 transcriptional regulator, MerR family [Thiomicrospira cyclica ALM1]
MTLLTIGKLAKQAGVKTDTLRYYEQLELILPAQRSASGYRLYSDNNIKQLAFIRRAQTLGFTLDEIKELLELHQQPSAQCGDIQQRAELKIAQINQRMADLAQIKLGLEQLHAQCHQGASLEQCSLIKHFYGDEHDNKT